MIVFLYWRGSLRLYSAVYMCFPLVTRLRDQGCFYIRDWIVCKFYTNNWKINYIKIDACYGGVFFDSKF